VYSRYTIRVIKLRKMKWAGHVARTGVCCGDLREKDQLEDLKIGGWIILKWVFKKWDGEARTGLLWLRMGTGGERWRMR